MLVLVLAPVLVLQSAVFLNELMVIDWVLLMAQMSVVVLVQKTVFLSAMMIMAPQSVALLAAFSEVLMAGLSTQVSAVVFQPLLSRVSAVVSALDLAGMSADLSVLLWA